MLLKQSTAYTRMFKLISSTDHISLKTGVSPVVNISKAGGAFGAAGGTVTEVSNGWYKVALTTTDTNTLGDIAFYITGTGADDTDFVDSVSANVLGDTLPASVAGAVGSVTAGVTVTTNNDKTGYSLAAGQLFIKKNVALSNFEFPMVDSTDHVTLKTGLTVAGQVSIDGAAFVNLTNSVAELASGVYKVNLAAADVNGTIIMLKFTSATADTRLILFTTQT